jgi:HEAT repeat protein
MFCKTHIQTVAAKALFGAFLALIPSSAFAAKPDLTASGVIEALKLPGGSSQYSARSYRDTYNLGATGMRGWIYDHNDLPMAGELGLTTDLSRQILVTTVEPSTPADGKLMKDDVILGVSWGNDSVPYFSSDARKSFGEAITEAERIINGGALNVKVWRAGQPATITDKRLTLAAIDTYSTTAPYNCPKSTKILANARGQLIKELKNNPNFLSSGYSFSGAVNGLALLSVVTKFGPDGKLDPDYNLVHLSLKSFVDNLNAPSLKDLEDPKIEGTPIWRLAYQNIFLCEFYMRSKDEGEVNLTALTKLKTYTAILARAQSRFGTFGHEISVLSSNENQKVIRPYGPVNCAGIAANLSIVLAKKAILTSEPASALDPEVDLAIERANKFFGYYVNKGLIPYGEHAPDLVAHSLNGKDEMCAVMFSLQQNHKTEAEYFSRISIAAYNGREIGHNGSGFNYLWEGLGANVGGPLAAAAYLKQIEWNLDLERRTNGSFTYDGQESAAYAGSTTSDGSYLGVSQYYGMNPTACHVLTYSVPSRSLYITGKDTYAVALSTDKVENAISAGSFQLNASSATNETLITKLGEYDPVVREEAAKQLKARIQNAPLTPAQVSSLVASITNGTLGTINAQIGACTALGFLKVPSALPSLIQRLSDTDLSVRGKAALALGNFDSTGSGQLETMLRVYTQNANNLEVIDWNDPIQTTNGFLSGTLFSSLKSSTITSSKSLLYPAIKIALKQLDSYQRAGAANFANDCFTFDDVKALTTDLVECVTKTARANTMYSMDPRIGAVKALEKYNMPEGIQAAMTMLQIRRDFGWGSERFVHQGIDTLASYGRAATPQLPALRNIAAAWALIPEPIFIEGRARLLQTIKIIESAFTYRFNSGSLQGWNNRVWNGSSWIDLPADVTTYSPIFPSSPNNHLFGVLNGAVSPMVGNVDDHLNTQWLRSPKFRLNGSMELTLQLSMGIANTTTAPKNDLSVPFAATNGGGWKGVALRRVSDGVFVLTKARTGNNGGEYRTVTFSKAELASLDQNVDYTLELINSDYGSWGWLTMDNVVIPGSVSTIPALSGITALTGVTAWGPNRVDTFAIGADKTLYWRFWNGSNWGSYSSLSTNVSAGVGATNWGENRLDAFYTGSNGSMRHKWYTGNWSVEEDLGGILVGAPAATSWATNRIDVFCRGTDNRLYWNYYNGSWSTWMAPGTGADVYSSPAVTNWGPNRLDVFYAGINGSLRHKWYTGSWSQEEDLGGVILGGPSAVAWNNSRIDVIVRGTDNQLYWNFWNGSSWVGFNALSTFAYSDPTVTSRGSGAFDIFYRGANGALKQKSYNSGSWTPEYDFGIPPSNGMTARARLLSVAPSAVSAASRFAVVASNSGVPSLPLPWIPGTIGSSQLSGTSTYNGSTISQSGSGALGTTSDKLNYSSQTLSGDGEITAKISALQDTGSLSRVGVMIRETLATNSKHVFMGMTGSNTYVTANRITTGGIATTGTVGTGMVPNTWVKLVRVGNVITASKSLDGSTWTTVGSTTVQMATNCYIGLAVSSGSDAVLNNSQFSNLSVTP